MDWIGLLQQQHAMIYGIIVVLALATLLLVLIRLFTPVRRNDDDEVADVKAQVRKWALRLYLLLWLLCVLLVVFRTFSIASSNRVPLNTTDRSAVYESSKTFRDTEPNEK